VCVCVCVCVCSYLAYFCVSIFCEEGQDFFQSSQNSRKVISPCPRPLCSPYFPASHLSFASLSLSPHQSGLCFVVIFCPASFLLPRTSSSFMWKSQTSPSPSCLPFFAPFFTKYHSSIQFILPQKILSKTPNLIKVALQLKISVILKVSTRKQLGIVLGHEIFHILSFSLCVYVWYWVLNSGPHAC
jgi:hypothetical protein